MLDQAVPVHCYNPAIEWASHRTVPPVGAVVDLPIPQLGEDVAALPVPGLLVRANLIIRFLLISKHTKRIMSTR